MDKSIFLIKSNRFLFILFLFIEINLFAETFDFVIQYLGIPVVDVTMKKEIFNNQIFIETHAKSRGLASHLADMDNYYSTICDSLLLPISYSKQINQKNYYEDREIIYERNSLIASRRSKISVDKNADYEIHLESRDFFSSLFYLRENLTDSILIMHLDANKLVWKAKCSFICKERIDTIFGEIETKKIEIVFSKISQEKKERTDILTNNLVEEGNILYFWFTADYRKIPVKAEYQRKPFSVIWKLKRYRENSFGS